MSLCHRPPQSFTPVQNRNSILNRSASRLLSRCAWVICAVLWVALSTTLCGCGTMNGYLMNRSGQRYFNKGNYEYARYEFERALMDSPHNASYAFNVARTMERQGEIENAEEMYQHALTIDPSHQPAYHGLASLLREQGRHDEASQLLTAWADTQPYHPGVQEMTGGQRAMQNANWYAQQQPAYHGAGAPQYMSHSAPMGMPQGYAPQQMAGPAMASRGGPQTSQYYLNQVPPSVRMATVMPRTDPTMMGGPVVAPQYNMAHQQYQQSTMQPTPSMGPTWSPTPEPGQYPQHQEMYPDLMVPEPQLIPDGSSTTYAPQSVSGPGLNVVSHSTGYSPNGAYPIHSTSMVMESDTNWQPVDSSGARTPTLPSTHTAPSVVQVVPAVQAF